MVKESIHTYKFGKGKLVPIEYDETKYKIMYIDDVSKIAIQRLSDEKIVYVSDHFSDYVVHIELENQTHFVIGEYDNKEQCNILRHYILWDDGTSYVHLHNEYKTSSDWLDYIRVGEHTFMVEPDGDSCCLYNLKKLSQRYNCVYNDKRLNFGKNTLLVEDIVAEGQSDLTDKIQYLIDVDTYEIVSNIKSEMQQRDIPIYSKKYAKELKLTLRNKIPVYNEESATIYNEITRYLGLIPEKYYKSPNVYYKKPNAYSSGKINEEYVRSFKRKNQK